jgi:uncharacterized integral membrane protein (TIGR00697 family)
MTARDKVYTGICVLFSVLLVVVNLTYRKFVALPLLPFYTFELSVGAILYPLTFLLTDLIAEFYGKERSTFCVKFSIAINITVALIIYIMDRLPAVSWSKIDDASFHEIFGVYSVAFTGSMIACYISQRVDIFFYLWIRRLTQGKYLWLRNNGSTAISLLIDTSVVISFLALFGVLPVERLWSLILSSYSFKLFFTICSTPLFYLSVFSIRFLIREGNFSSKKESAAGGHRDKPALGISLSQ